MIRWLVVIAVIFFAGAAASAPADKARGAKIYIQRCLMCHGEDGDGGGPGAKRLNPPPRDFTEALYKFKTTGTDEPVPNDDDILRMIRDGMPGTAMPGWKDILSEQDIIDLVLYLKIFAEIEEEKPEEQIDYGTEIASSPESIAAGDKLFHEGERCSECHGRDGRGDAVKRLKDDSGARTWPRNLTKPWTYRVSTQPRDIYRRITTGITGTQMPSFADPKSKKKLSIEERWQVANYVASLAASGQPVRAENTVIKAARIVGALPAKPGDAAWDGAERTTFFLLPQIIAKPRFFTPSNDTITARALYNDDEIAFLIEWDDRTKSIPGDADAAKIAEPDMGPDAVAVQLPIEPADGSEKPYFIWGDATHPVNLWKWQSGTTKAPETVEVMTARGLGNVDKRANGGVSATGIYDNGIWRVIMKRARATADAGKDLQFREGEFIPIAFSAWDGSNGENDRSHTLTTWYWLQLKPEAGAKPLLAGILTALILAGLLIWWARTAKARPESGA
ncbi:MAG: c-type cytochrome [Rhodospirillaceae bacterium]|jgi:DMSO reductase family type II enzyme heme b subunit|nr:c-type cytochrome [Rhodospirillaceae bacterium]MBT3883558.1 c-type cytochrome [Rhodospirillaceae bacterium]MBT4117535.1 c-type cytochrome [Rhodospirillaceae bacterium]MBT4670634.1 c-type cytochrome [Rhodospirillaceae bacterium]MBT4721101.1 c-type cytochrome [Rhodospirillaceae bacterium]